MTEAPQQKWTTKTVPPFGAPRLGYGDRLLPAIDPDDVMERGQRVASLYIDNRCVHETYYSDHAPAPSDRWLYDTFISELRMGEEDAS